MTALSGGFLYRPAPRWEMILAAGIFQAVFSLIFSPVIGGSNAGGAYWLFMGVCGFFWWFGVLQLVRNFNELEFDARQRRLIWRNTLTARFGRRAVAASADRFRAVRTVSLRRQRGFMEVVELLGQDGRSGVILYSGDSLASPRPGALHRDPCAYESDEAVLLRMFFAWQLKISDAGCVGTGRLARRAPKEWFTKL